MSHGHLFNFLHGILHAFSVAQPHLMAPHVWRGGSPSSRKKTRLSLFPWGDGSLQLSPPTSQTRVCSPPLPPFPSEGAETCLPRAERTSVICREARGCLPELAVAGGKGNRRLLCCFFVFFVFFLLPTNSDIHWYLQIWVHGYLWIFENRAINRISHNFNSFLWSVMGEQFSLVTWMMGKIFPDRVIEISVRPCYSLIDVQPWIKQMCENMKDRFLSFYKYCCKISLFNLKWLNSNCYLIPV